MKFIELTQGKKAIVDDEDFEMLSKFKWSCGGRGYARRRESGKTIWMHRIILNPKLSEQVDHISRDKLDNRRMNLRICNPSENNFNCKIDRKNNTSGFKGVSKSGKKWVALIQAYKKQFHLGTFDNKIHAAQAYNQAAIKYHGKFARLNIL